MNSKSEKKEALISGDIRRLDEIVLREQSYIMKMESYEMRREKLLMQEGLAGVTISEIISNHLNDKYIEAYRDVFAKLNDIIFELKKINHLNQRLLRARLSVIYRMDKILSYGSNK